MKKIPLLLLAPLLLVAKVHYAKVESYESVVLKSAISGIVTNVALDSEGKTSKTGRIIHIDDHLDTVNLATTKVNVELLKKMLNLNKNIANNQKNTVDRQESYYKRISKLTTSSRTQKDNAYNAFISSKTQYFATREKIINLEKQIGDMGYKIEKLKDSILKKSINVKDKYIYKIIVRAGDFVAPGSPLVHIKDMSRAKLVLFVEKEEIALLAEKTIYLNDKKTDYKIDKVWKVADEKFISSYRAEIYIDAPKESFSQLIKIELK